MVTLDELLDLAERHARTILLEVGYAQLQASFVLLAPSGQVQIVGCDWDGDLDKEIAIAGIRAIAHDMNAVALSHVSEAWVSQYRSQEEADNALPPSQSPDRREIVIVLATNGIETKARIFDIKRDWKGKIRELVADQGISGDSFAGRMIDGILPIGGNA